MPPVPPQVAAQQQGPPPLRQFAQGGAGAPPPSGDAGQNPDALAASLIDGIGKQMTQLAQVIGTTRPELIPILKQAVQALVMVSSKVKVAEGAPQGGNQGTAGDTAPDAGGGAATGMQQ